MASVAAEAAADGSGPSKPVGEPIGRREFQIHRLDGQRPSCDSRSGQGGAQRTTLTLASSLAGSGDARFHNFYLLSSGIPFPRWSIGARPAARLKA